MTIMKITCIVGLLCATVAAADQFNVDEMPIGAEVTLPGTATTMVPASQSVRITSTDAPQTISIVPISQVGVAAQPVMLSIYDPAKNVRIKHVQIAPGTPFLYSFKGLGSVRLRTDAIAAGGKSTQALRLKIESDKPITVAR